MEITTTSDAAFQAEVLDAPLPVLVDFTAVWCAPCKMLDPVVIQLAKALGEKVKVFKLDVDENPEVTMRYQIMTVPTLILFAGGQPVQRLTGYQSKDRLIKKFSPHL